MLEYLFLFYTPSRLTATELDRILSKAEKSLEKAESAVRKTDPGRVSNLLRRVDEEMARFQTGSRLTELVQAFATGRSAAGGGNMEEAGEAVRRARLILPTLSDYMVMRQAEFEGRVALHSAELDDAEGYLVALDRLESAVLPTLLSARITEFREAIARGRDAMVRRDMETGRAEVASARQALDGLHLAGALSMLPPWDLLVMPNAIRQIGITELNCNWLQCQENTGDPLHNVYVHGYWFKYVLEKKGRLQEVSGETPADQPERTF